MRRTRRDSRPDSRQDAEPVPDRRWSVVVPVKGTSLAKSRLGASAELAEAIALDTVAAVLRARSVSRVLVVTSPSAAQAFRALGAEALPDPGDGLNAACRFGIAAADGGPVAVLLGDVPALLPEELDAALELAARPARSFVADFDNDGTVLIAALDAASHSPAFGSHSRAAHLAAGYVELAVPSAIGLRRDVDTPEQLRALAADSLGARTSAVLKRLTLNT